MTGADVEAAAATGVDSGVTLGVGDGDATGVCAKTGCTTLKKARAQKRFVAFRREEERRRNGMKIRRDGKLKTV
jgi:hypothetical protein